MVTFDRVVEEAGEEVVEAGVEVVRRSAAQSIACQLSGRVAHAEGQLAGAARASLRAERVKALTRAERGQGVLGGGGRGASTSGERAEGAHQWWWSGTQKNRLPRAKV